VKTTRYWSCIITSGGGQGFEDTSLAGLLTQTKAWVSSYPVGRGDYTAADRWHNRFVLWAIQANRPSSISDEHGIGFAPTIH
jgi:hypothetical protein